MRKLDRGQKAGSITIPAPVGGLNTRDALAAMEPTYAVTIRDIFPNGTHVEARKGYSSAQTITGLNSSSALPGFVKYGETSLWLAAYDQAASEMELKSLGGSTQTVTGHAVDYAPIYTQIANSGGNFVAVIFRNNSAANNYYTYDGTTWTARTGTTTNSQAFNFVAAFRNRLWFLTDTAGKELSVYYLPTQAITGTTVEFPLGGVANKGGKLYAIGTWTRDGGEGGSDDLIVFSTTAGQVIVYQGTDPSSSSTFGLVGVFDIARPVGKPFKFGSDLLMPTEDGLYSMNAILGGQSGSEYAISDIIREKWQEYAYDAINNYSASTRVDRVTLAYSPAINHLMVMFRGQVANGVQANARVLVMNTVTKAWTQYIITGGYSVDSFNGKIYFGNMVDAGGGSYTATAYLFAGSATDNGTPILAFCVPAYTNFGLPGRIKQITAIRPTLESAGVNSITSGTMHGVADFAVNSLSGLSQVTVSSPYNGSSGVSSPVLSLPVVGSYVSIGCSLTTSGFTSLKWYSTDIFFVPGGPV